MARCWRRAGVFLLVLGVLSRLNLSCATDTPKFFRATDSSIAYTGRILVDDAAGRVSFDWPCVTIDASFKASSISILMEGGNNDFFIFLDGKELPKISTTEEKKLYMIADNLEDTMTHNVSIHKITEASFFVFEPLLPLSRVIFHGIVLKGNEVALQSQRINKQTRRIEVFGDSDSNGFGIEGADDFDCIFSLTAYENCYAGYASLLSRALDAELYVEAWSGKGVVKNAVGFYYESEHPMPIYWNRTIATETSHIWDFNQYSPDLVIVLLGTNDYFAWPYPSDDEFIGGYVRLLENIVSSYKYLPQQGQPTLVALCGGTLDNDRAPCANVEKAAKAFASHYSNTHYVEIGRDWLTFPDDYGCLEHRNVRGQQKLAAKLLPTIQKIMGW